MVTPKRRRLDPPVTVTAPFGPLMAQGSLYCRVIGDELMQLLAHYQCGHLDLDACEAEIGQCTAARLAKELAGDSQELRLAITEELDALRRCAIETLDSLSPSQ